jgi:hypothetical protein
MLWGMPLNTGAALIAVVAGGIQFCLLCYAIAIDPQRHYKGHWTTMDLMKIFKRRKV